VTKVYRIPISVLVYCFRRDTDGIGYLILRRTPRYGGFWQGVTGAVEGNETPLDGARRELTEETQLSPASLIQVEFSYTFLLEDEWKPAYAPGVESVTEFVFLAEISDGSEPILSFEHDLYEWMPYAPAMRRLKWPNNQRALEFCNCLLTS
jgi:dATP pyrophosphohydrolase